MYTKKRQLEFQVVFISYLLITLCSGLAAFLILKASGKLMADFFHGSFLINVALPLAVSILMAQNRNVSVPVVRKPQHISSVTIYNGAHLIYQILPERSPVFHH